MGKKDTKGFITLFFTITIPLAFGFYLGNEAGREKEAQEWKKLILFWECKSFDTDLDHLVDGKCFFKQINRNVPDLSRN